MIYVDSFDTPLGRMQVGATEDAIFMLEFEDNNLHELSRPDIAKHFQDDIAQQENAPIQLVKKQINEYFNSSRKQFDVPLHFWGTIFQVKVWQSLMDIPFGSTVSYSHQSKVLGDVKAIRAVASANGKNKIAIIVPCHRVIGSDGALTGYAGGLDRKKWLLDFENPHKQLSIF